MKLSLGKYIIVRIAHSFSLHSAINVILIGPCVVGLPLECLLREDIIFIDQVVPSHFICRGYLMVDIVIGIVGVIVDSFQ